MQSSPPWSTLSIAQPAQGRELLRGAVLNQTAVDNGARADAGGDGGSWAGYTSQDETTGEQSTTLDASSSNIWSTAAGESPCKRIATRSLQDCAWEPSVDASFTWPQ